MAASECRSCATMVKATTLPAVLGSEGSKIDSGRQTGSSFSVVALISDTTFSNSKRMEDAFDVQRDHIRLMTDLKRLLRKGGTIMFSNNKRGFRMDHDGLAALGLKAQEISQKTLSQDFARNRQIHNCWLITAA